jgi:S-adenosylmethionine-dependent methyltransferase
MSKQRSNQLNQPQFSKYILTDQDIISKIEQGLRTTYFANYEEGFLDTELGLKDIEANVYKRYNNSLSYVVPWVARYIDLKDTSLVEIGSGTGSSTAAFAHFVKSIHGYDIDAPAVEGARKRLEILGLTNTVIDIISGDELVSKLQANHQTGMDIVLLFAVLEHQTVEERVETLKTCWELLNPDGLLVVVETPNLLPYFDFHTSLLPFQHFLPTETYARYSEFSPRNGFNHFFKNSDLKTGDQLEIAISRWGRGVSYHDFELAYGADYARYIVANGFESEMLSWVDVCLEEEVLRYYIERANLNIPRAFCRVSLSLILQKSENIKACDDSNVPDFRYLARPEDIAQKDQRIRELELHLEDRIQYLTDIIQSRRWKLANAITSPYRFVKTKIFGK